MAVKRSKSVRPLLFESRSLLLLMRGEEMLTYSRENRLSTVYHRIKGHAIRRSPFHIEDDA